MVEHDKALEAALSQIEKQFGKGSVILMGDNTSLNIGSIPTGALSLDLALGVGGLPKGRIIELYGPESAGKSTLALSIVAEAQKLGGTCAYIDVEHALDPVYAKAIGVDIDKLLMAQPDSGEEALEIVDTLTRSGSIALIVIDSVAALVTKAEIEGEMGASHPGIQARLMGQAMRKINASLSRTDTIALFINQLREKIGVIYGCFSYGTRIVLADGTTEKIGKIVNQKRPIEVLSYDPKADAVTPKKVVNWFDNGPTDHFLQFTVVKPRKNGRARFACTPNHEIRTPVGWRAAGELVVGDRVMQALPRRLSAQQVEFLLGSLMGDGALSPTRSGYGASFRYTHCAAQIAYADWKAELLGNIERSRFVHEDGVVEYDFTPLPELADIRHAVYVGGKKTFSDDYLKQLTPLSLAVWYMDDAGFTIRAKGVQERTKDGSGRAEICVEGVDPATRIRLCNYLADTWGVRPTLRTVGASKKAVLIFPKDETAKLHALIAPFVHPSMDYKLLPRYRGQFAVKPLFVEPQLELVALPIMDIHVKPPNHNMHRFDIEVEDSHNYLADGVVVHNSPETQPGGRALKFYASIRLDIRRAEAIKDGAEIVGNRTRVKVVKNKCAPPFRTAEFDIMFGQGISREGSVLDTAVDFGIVKKSGAWYTYEGEQLGQGRENCKLFFRDHPELMAEIDGLVRKEIATPSVPTEATE